MKGSLFFSVGSCVSTGPPAAKKISLDTYDIKHNRDEVKCMVQYKINPYCATGAFVTQSMEKRWALVIRP